jgi:phosphohistidine swiveling domain-containing protein
VAELSSDELLRHLRETRNALEQYAGDDVCDFEFVVEDGKVFVTNSRVAKRTAIANLRFALQFLAEGRITLPTFLARIRPRDVQAFIGPTLAPSNRLVAAGRGLPASSGVATGQVVFPAGERGTQVTASPTILVTHEVVPDDLPLLCRAKGCLTMVGGMTSHAAVICRQLGLSSVVNFGGRVDSALPALHLRDGQQVREGDWLTIDGTTGEVFLGKAKFQYHRWQDTIETSILHDLLNLAVLHNLVPKDCCGHCWRIRDYFSHGVPLVDVRTEKRPTQASVAPKRPSAERMRQLNSVALSDRDNITAVIWGLHRTLGRVLANRLGIGQHHRYVRPLWDPADHEAEGRDWLSQGVGIEFFDINRFVDWLPDIARIAIRLQIEYQHGESGCFLDHTNPNGDSLVEHSETVSRYELLVNESHVSPLDLAAFYNYVRRREYRFSVYFDYGTQAEDLRSFLSSPLGEWAQHPELVELSRILGLVVGTKLTDVGKSFVGQLTWKESE